MNSRDPQIDNMRSAETVKRRIASLVRYINAKYPAADAEAVWMEIVHATTDKLGWNPIAVEPDLRCPDPTILVDLIASLLAAKIFGLPMLSDEHSRRR
jgi:hypothetical protein